jgi:hypothetical protein
MQSVTATVPDTRVEKTDWRRLVGRILSALVVLFMAFDGVGKLVVEKHVAQSMAELGWPPGQTVGLGVLILVCTALYANRRTAFVGALLLTAFLGGATAEKVRMEEASFLFSVGIGVLAWLGLYLQDERLRALVWRRR